MSNIDFLKAVSKAQELVAELNSNNEDETNLNNQTPPNSPSGLTIGTKRPVDVDIDQVIEKKVKTNEEGLLAETEEILKTKEITVYHMIPEQCVGLVIGKKGLQIVQLQKDSCCKVIIPQECGKGFRELTMIGTLSQIEQAKQMINEIITRSGRLIQDNVEENNNTTSLDIMIPGPKAGLIIGRNGDTIKHIKESSGANLVLIQDSKQASEEGKPLRITGDSQSVEKAKEMVEKFLSTTSEKNMLQLHKPIQRTADSCVYPVPINKVGLVIGKGGETIREIFNHSGAYVALSKQESVDPSVKLFDVIGQRYQIDMAIRFISERAGISISAPQSYTSAEHQDNYYVDPNTQYYNNSQQPITGYYTNGPSYNPQTGEVDYTAAWQEYYQRQQQQPITAANQQYQVPYGTYNNDPYGVQKTGAAAVAQQPAAPYGGYDYSKEWQRYNEEAQRYQQYQQHQQQYYYGNQQQQQQQPAVQHQEGQPKPHQLAAWTIAAQSGYNKTSNT